MSSANTIFKVINPMMMAVLKSPFHNILSKGIMIITFNGRLTGRKYSTPVSYYQADDEVICFTHANWWKNLKGSAPVQLLVRGKELGGSAEPIPDDTEIKLDGLNKLLQAVPGDARFYDVRFDEHGQLDQDDLRHAAENSVMIHIQLDQNS